MEIPFDENVFAIATSNLPPSEANGSRPYGLPGADRSGSAGRPQSESRLPQEIQDLAAQLQSLINQAEIEQTAAIRSNEGPSRPGGKPLTLEKETAVSGSLLPLASPINVFQRHNKAGRAGSPSCGLTITTCVATTMLAIAPLIDASTPVIADEKAQASSNAQTESAGSKPDFAAEIRWKLRKLQDRMINLASPAVRPVDPTASLRNQLVPLQVEVKSTEMKLENAKLAREVAEIKLIEYQEGIYVQDKAVLEGASVLAERELERKRDLLKFAKRLLAEARSPSKNLPADSAKESRTPTMWRGRKSSSADVSWRWQTRSRRSRTLRVTQGRNESRRSAPRSRRHDQELAAPGGARSWPVQAQIADRSDENASAPLGRQNSSRRAGSPDEGLTTARNFHRGKAPGQARSTRGQS